ncbi:Zinc finger and BTB domain-containing protein 14 [Orchesella cincta]|uniref:Zinc finger and BTB domain-containing protein 14 n=1 Tax=Orchesella cincta TaxID=48709 RepID=A0A1D2N0J2_ORCCI|nr:Zinc finger and BTB domain-containing protein 14 [Orchesella cincta]
MKARKVKDMLNVSDSSDSGTSTLMYQLSSAESSPSPSSSVSMEVCLEEQSGNASQHSTSCGSMDELYFVPATLQEISSRSSINGETIRTLDKPFASTPLQRQATADDERTPTGTPKLCRVKERVKKTSPRLSVRPRRTKPLSMCMKSRRSGVPRKTGMTKIIEVIVKKEMKGFESRIHTIATSMKEEVLAAMQQQLKESLDGFKDKLENGVQKKRRVNTKSSCSVNDRKFAASEKSNGKNSEMTPTPVKAAALSPAPVDASLPSSTKLLLKPDEMTHDSSSLTTNEETKASSPPKRSTAFGALLKYVHSKTLLEKLTASLEKNRIVTKTNDTAGPSASSGSGNRKDASQSVCEMISSDCIKQEPLAYLESLQQETNQISAPIIAAQPIRNPEQPSSNNTCKALVPYVRKSSVPTKIIIGIPKPGSELVPKPELALRKYREPLACDYCGKQFWNNSSLKQHTSFHRPHRPYQCNHSDCQKAYKTRSELNRHLVVHAGVKNYVCTQCGKTFLRKQYLKTHLLRHEESLIWSCNLCSKIFVTQHDLEKHKVSYHKNGKRAHRNEDQSKQLALTYNSSDLHA